MVKLAKNIKHLAPREIVIPEERQRRGGAEIDTSDLEPSIRARGIYNPIIITKGLQLVAGERRLRVALKDGHATIPTRFIEDLDEIEVRIVELEENERRKDLDWKDHTRAVAKLHELYDEKAKGAGEGWSQVKTAEMLFYTAAHIGRIIRVAQDIDNPKIANAPGLAAAFNVLSRIDERRIGDALSDIASAGRLEPKPPASAEAQAAAVSAGATPAQAAKQTYAAPAKPAVLPASESILLESFLTWAPTYSGPKFSFIHCDFPYGTNVFGGPQSGRGTQETYDDNPDVYWELIRAFCKHRDRFMTASAHMMFWYDMDYHTDTLRLFEELAPDLVFRSKPLIWTKSDNSGILSDPKRGPRHIYESCLVASREDRLIVRAKSDSYACHTDKDHHPSTKPESMLRYFMEMYVDEHTMMLDPTCGSGAALRAAESLGAARVLGLEINKEFHEAACSALRQFRTKALAAKLIKPKEAKQ